MALLSVEHIDVAYGDVQVISDLSLTVEEGEVVSIIGGNGAGKSTRLKAISGLLMRDEPSLGLAPILVKSIFDTLRKIAATGTTVLLVEQDVNHSLQLSDRGYVLEHGRVALAGQAADLLENPHVKSAYLGI